MSEVKIKIETTDKGAVKVPVKKVDDLFRVDGIGAAVALAEVLRHVDLDALVADYADILSKKEPLK